MHIHIFSLLILLVTANNYDFIVIGAGTAGSLIAKELSDNSTVSVLVLEQGNDYSDILDHAVGFYDSPLYGIENYTSWFSSKMVPNHHMYSQETVGGGTSEYATRCELLGGCASLNGNAFGRLTERDLGSWNSSLWTYNATLNDWTSLESTSDGDPLHHGSTGPIITKMFPLDPHMTAIKQAVKQTFEVSENIDSSDDNADGISSMFRNMYVDSNGVAHRQTTYNKILRPVLNRTNLVVHTGAFVLKIKFNSDDKHTVVYLRDNEIVEVTAIKEIIVSTGTMTSPKLLQLSGIGDCDYLNTLNITCVYNNTSVGKYLREHIATAMIYIAVTPPANFSHGGIIANYYKSPIYTKDGTDMELAIGGTLRVNDTGLIGFNFEEFGLFDVNDINGYLFQLAQTKHNSYGELKIKSKSPFIDPLFTFNLWKNEDDADAMVDMFKKIRQSMLIANLYASTTFTEIYPGPNQLDTTATDNMIKDYLISKKNTLIHPTGTCGMHRVVDERLRVYGVKNLRVIDNSIMPESPSTHSTCSGAMLIGKVGARLIKEDWNI